MRCPLPCFSKRRRQIRCAASGPTQRRASRQSHGDGQWILSFHEGRALPNAALAPTLSASLGRARELHEQGRFDAAAPEYEAVLASPA